MKKMYKIATVLLAFCFLLGSVPMSVKAEDYTYKVTIYSGKQGTFTGIPGNLVKENNATVSISDDKSAIVIDKLNPNDSVNMSELLPQFRWVVTANIMFVELKKADVIIVKN